MSDITPITVDDAKAGFSSGERALDDYFARHAVGNDAQGIGRAYVLRRSASDDSQLPTVLGFYTLSMASVTSSEVGSVLQRRLPRYPLPVALIGRLAVDTRAQRRGFGQLLLVDALRRVVQVASQLGCIGVIVDAKNASAQAFYEQHDFVTLPVSTGWPQRLFLPIQTAQLLFDDQQ